VIGVAGVIVLYVGVNFICLRTLGAAGLAATHVPASSVMRIAMGERGARWIALGITISALGFLSQSVLTGPRVYFAMARDKLFFAPLAWVSPRSHVPIAAIVVQSIWTVVIALSGRYEQILNYVVSMDFLFFGLTGAALFQFRRREGKTAHYRAPGHPFTTVIFIAACWLVVAGAIYKYPANTLIGVVILLLGLPVYGFWAARQRASM